MPSMEQNSLPELRMQVIKGERLRLVAEQYFRDGLRQDYVVFSLIWTACL